MSRPNTATRSTRGSPQPEYIDRDGWTHAGTYRDAGVSGATPFTERPDGAKLVGSLDSLDVIVTGAVDRAGRDIVVLNDLWRRLKDADVEMVYLRETFGDDASGEFMRDIAASMSKYERQVGRERTSAGIAGRARSGKPWGEPGYGYRRGDEAHWVTNPTEQRIVDRIYRLYVHEGMSYSGIARRLNREGIPTRRGSRWSPTVVRRILTSRHVLGRFHHGAEWHRGRHEAIIDPETWEEAQRLAERGRKYAPKGAGRLPKRHLFIKGMLRCGVLRRGNAPALGRVVGRHLHVQDPQADRWR